MDDKTKYETPTIKDHGDLTELTALGRRRVHGRHFPAGTPAGDITFSTP